MAGECSRTEPLPTDRLGDCPVRSDFKSGRAGAPDGRAPGVPRDCPVRRLLRSSSAADFRENGFSAPPCAECAGGCERFALPGAADAAAAAAAGVVRVAPGAVADALPLSCLRHRVASAARRLSATEPGVGLESFGRSRRSRSPPAGPAATSRSPGVARDPASAAQALPVDGEGGGGGGGGGGARTCGGAAAGSSRETAGEPLPSVGKARNAAGPAAAKILPAAANGSGGARTEPPAAPAPAQVLLTGAVGGDLRCDACPFCDDICDSSACDACYRKKLSFCASRKIFARSPAAHFLLVPGAGLAVAPGKCASGAASASAACEATRRAGAFAPLVRSVDRARMARGKRRFSLCEVLRHRGPDDCWLVVDGCAYDVTLVLDVHPAGAECILRAAGTDAAESFRFHSAAAQRAWRALAVGDVVPCPGHPGSEALAPPEAFWKSACRVM